MRVLLTSPYDLAVPGGVNRHALDLLDAFTAAGIDAKLVAPASVRVRGDDPRVVCLGRVHTRPMNGAQSRVTLDWSIGGAIRRLMREFRPDVLHSQEPFLPLLNTFCLWAAPRWTVRVGTFHTYSETSRGYLWAWPYCALVARRLDARIAVSAAARDFAARYHPEQYHIVPSGVRQVAAGQRRGRRGVSRPVRLVFVGRYDEPRKGFDVLVAALRELQVTQPNVFRLRVVGPGEPRTFDDLPITFAGELSDAELQAEWAASDVCCLPSRGGESFGLVALEALAHGVPVVASRIRGYAEWLGDTEAAALVTPGDPTALARALTEFTTDAARFAGALEATSEVAARYHWPGIVENLRRIYVGAANPGGALDR